MSDRQDPPALDLGRAVLRARTQQPLNALQAMAHRVDMASLALPATRIGGTVCEIRPSLYRVTGMSQFVGLGESVEIDGAAAGRVTGEVVRIEPHGVLVKPYKAMRDAALGSLVWRAGRMSLPVSPGWKGRVITALGDPIDQKGPMPSDGALRLLDREPPAAMTRQRVCRPLTTGIRAIDFFTPICLGQRLGIFAGSGVGKSTLLAMIAAAQSVDTVVVAMVGERGREVREFIEDALGPAMSRCVVVVATSEESAMVRRLAPRAALTVAEYFRDRGDSVLLMIDSVTRYAHALREVALSAGEPPVARGYPPSVFSDLPRLLERAGPGESGSGSITAILSVLVDGDDHNEPVADAIRGTLDGHVVLSRAIAEQDRFPAIDPLRSLSRLAAHVWTPQQRQLVTSVRAMLARYEDTKDVRLIGGYVPGTDPELDAAITLVPRIYQMLRQSPSEQQGGNIYDEMDKLAAAIGSAASRASFARVP